MAASSDDRKFWSEFIELYKQQSNDSNDKGEINDAYDVLLEKLKEKDDSATRDTVEMTIKEMRSSYLEELEKVEASKKSGGDIYTPSLWYFDLLHFTQDQGIAGSSGCSIDKNADTTSSRIRVVAKGQKGRLEEDDKIESDLLYGVEDNPSWTTCILLGFQHYLTMAGSTLPIPVMLCGLMCIGEEDPARSFIISATYFVSGIITLLQVTFGVRLPIVQGGSAAYLVPTFIILTTHFKPCSRLDYTNATSASEMEEIWLPRMREVSGAITLASLLQVFLGFTGLVGLMLRWITPLAIAPTISLIGLSLFDFAGNMAAQNWGIAGLTMLLIALFSQYLENIPIVFGRGKPKTKFYIFKLFPVLLAVVISWSLCAILTLTNVLPEGDKARTDLAPELLAKTPWFIFPYPGIWGAPTVSASAVIGMIAAVVSSVIESIGDYYACAKIAGAPPPPVSAINRGIFIEGVGCLLTGLFGTANGSTSFSQNIGVITITKVGSRRVVQCSAIFMIALAMFGKIEALFISIPKPIVGGLLCVMFSVIAAVGLSTLQHVNLSSSRNIFIVGSSLFLGLAIPKWLKNNEGIIKTGSLMTDQILTILLGTSMFVGGFIGFILDNTIPGTPRDRGLLEWQTAMRSGVREEDMEEAEISSEKSRCYDLPFGMDFIKRTKWLKHVPISPTFSSFRINRKRRREEFV